MWGRKRKRSPTGRRGHNRTTWHDRLHRASTGSKRRARRKELKLIVEFLGSTNSAFSCSPALRKGGIQRTAKLDNGQSSVALCSATLGSGTVGVNRTDIRFWGFRWLDLPVIHFP